MTETLDDIRQRLRAAILADEAETIARLREEARLSPAERDAVSHRGAGLVRSVREAGPPVALEAFLSEYGLSTREGVALMCLAEAMLRVPDAETIDELIRDKIAPHDWGSHVGDSGSILVNASTWALMLTGRVLEDEEPGIAGALRGLVRRMGEPVIRTAVAGAMKELGGQFVLGQTIEEAMKRGRPMEEKGYTYSYDMLGEAARTEADAARYREAYRSAIASIAKHAKSDEIAANPGISVKLSALHPRYEFGKGEAMIGTLAERTLELARQAARARIGFNIDAEEADRLDPSLDVIERVLSDPELAGWDGFSVVVQAYGQRAGPVLDWLHALAEKLDRRIMVRLVKGAYWDTEIKRAQVMGLDGFPVFTRKINTDISYIANARKLLEMRGRIYPQFATHNAHTAAAVLHMAGDRMEGFEFQRLHGMGEALHEAIRKKDGTRCRIYAPVGKHRDLLAYLVRRLLENGANSSFVHQIADTEVPPEEIARDPFAELEKLESVAHPKIARGTDLYGRGRRNSKGWDITDPADVARIEAGRAPFASPHQWTAGAEGMVRGVVNPADPDDVVGQVFEADAAMAKAAVGRAIDAQPGWAATPVAERGAILNRVADLYEAAAEEFFAIAAREAGKTPLDAVAEVREAVDFLRYYAMQAPRVEQGTAARGVIACISPWNFPLAIFTGQVAAALATGNAVIAKPAEQTPLIAARAVEAMHEAGVPADVLQLLPGDGPSVGAPLTADPRLAGVCFTGSTEVAKRIERQLAETGPADAMLIAETGGLNAMIVDSTALPEQAVRDILASAFQSAGQRCSALRVLYVQDDVADTMLEMLFGAMDSQALGDPWSWATDVGPVIDEEARDDIRAYVDAAEQKGRVLKRMAVPERGLFVGPAAIEVSGIGEMEREVFGPVLHIARYDAEKVDSVVREINARGYGLTFGMHSRIDRRVQDLVEGVHVGNLYVNRNQIGAIVGCQPFGGEGLSGTGPKAGGPHYLRRFRRAVEAPQDAPSGKAIGADDLRKALSKLDAGGWAGQPGRVTALRNALRGRAEEAMAAAAALDCGPIDLPGPTGESNRYWLNPRGPVLCLGPTAEAALDQAVQALRIGAPALMAAPGAREAAQPLIEAKLPVAALDGEADATALAELEIGVAAFCGGADRMRALKKALAAREGPITPLIAERIHPAAFAHERAICIDTTAAGGNAQLLGSV
ncbi:bifunctional proline dehydrogenase/L-glutamate gamma-semialdehyde dehydrogenase PutA [Minwuia thermotolerans]|uniref:Bifunctional protein PutA n=1 Tax=Minwuia thermotolerans TaxID=2056226 RepID=A0A2M9G292_9PROT|nr:bifunctional proline dehydrogenase/L-glutamate gamma-semialdehyde dehydrogenase PutA [Minwuia thermotolerans]PJK29810.1 bifunctional proline dehydrogenase/L-glutamate gamma-semialdehyde dehydrogenase [Minwuia thermotolerans]